MNTKRLVASAAILVLLLAGAWFLLMNKDEANTANQAPLNTSTTTEDMTTEEPNSSEGEDEVAAVTINYDGSTFTPNSVSIKTGERVRVVNNSSRTIDFASDEHPQHTDNSELNIGILTPNQSKSFVIEKTGTWNYHDHLNASQTGSIVVE